MEDKLPEAPTLGRIIIFTKCVAEMIAFYSRHFGYELIGDPNDGIVELLPPPNGLPILLHETGRARKAGQVQIKLVFDVKDVPAFCEKAQEDGLIFGTVHQTEGYAFANAKDPSGNNVSVSSRAFRQA